jgi:hypothetical protein
MSTKSRPKALFVYRAKARNMTQTEHEPIEVISASPTHQKCTIFSYFLKHRNIYFNFFKYKGITKIQEPKTLFQTSTIYLLLPGIHVLPPRSYKCTYIIHLISKTNSITQIAHVLYPKFAFLTHKLKIINSPIWNECLSNFSKSWSRLITTRCGWYSYIVVHDLFSPIQPHNLMAIN